MLAIEIMEDVRQPAWDSMGLCRGIPVFKAGSEYAIRTRQAIFNLARCIKNNGSQIVVSYQDDRCNRQCVALMISDILSAREVC